MIRDEIPIRTVRINSKNTGNYEEFKESVATFGEFESQIYTQKIHNEVVSFVTFKNASGARNALKSELCMPVDEWLEPSFIGHHLRSEWPTIEPERKFDYISGLNDKCLIDIFSHLGIKELQMLAKVSQRFRHIVTNFMISKTNVQLYAKEDMKNVHCFLTSFGSFVTKLALSSPFYDYNTSVLINEVRCGELLLVIPKYCSNDHLESLDLTDISTNYFPIESYRESKIFLKLRVLKIQASTNQSIMEEILKLCSSLKTLNVRCETDEMCGSYLKFIPVDIEQVTIGAFVEEEFLHSLVEKSQRLKQLSCHIRTTSIIAKIVKFQPRLEKFEMQSLGFHKDDFTIDKDALTIKNLKQLKSFKLEYPWTMDVEIINAVSEMDSVVVLVINTEADDGYLFLPAIKKMKNLKNLRLATYPSDTYKQWKEFLSNIAVTNPNLENLDIDCVVLFEYFLPVVTSHPRLKTLVVNPILFLEDDGSESFDMESFRKVVKSREQGKQNFPIILKVDMNTELYHFSKICNKYDHLVRIVKKRSHY